MQVETLGCDLGKQASRARLPGRIASLGLEVDILANNAGFATGGRFDESDPERELEQVRVLCEAPVALTSAFLPGMIERKEGAILNVASTAAFMPLPYSAGYSAAKAHSLAFSEALHGEVAGRGVTVTALCPGPVKTEFWEVAGDQPIEATVPDLVWVTPEECAKAAVDGSRLRLAGRRPGPARQGRLQPHADAPERAQDPGCRTDDAALAAFRRCSARGSRQP